MSLEEKESLHRKGEGERTELFPRRNDEKGGGPVFAGKHLRPISEISKMARGEKRGGKKGAITSGGKAYLQRVITSIHERGTISVLGEGDRLGGGPIVQDLVRRDEKRHQLRRRPRRVRT